MFRREPNFEVLLVHPGGPYWAKKDAGAWSIPKGEIGAGEEALPAAVREFQEETGFQPCGPFIPLGTEKQPSGKLVTAWAFEGNCDPSRMTSNTFAMEWPPKSGKMQEFPEMDRAEWFGIAEALKRILAGQVLFLHELEKKILGRPAPDQKDGAVDADTKDDGGRQRPLF